MKRTVVLRLTRSQHMALIDVLIAYIRSDEVQNFVDVARDVTTTAGELLALVSSIQELEEGS